MHRLSTYARRSVLRSPRARSRWACSRPPPVPTIITDTVISGSSTVCTTTTAGTRAATTAAAMTATLRPGTVGAPVATGLNGPFGVDVDARERPSSSPRRGPGTMNAPPAPGPGLGVPRRHEVRRSRPIHRSSTTSIVNRRGRFRVHRRRPDQHPGDHRSPTVARARSISVRTRRHTTRTAASTYGPRFDLAAAAGPACWSTVDPEVQQVATAIHRASSIPDAFRTTRLPDGSRAVADAAGNDVLRVDRHGAISVLAVLPPNVVHVTAADLSGPAHRLGRRHSRSASSTRCPPPGSTSPSNRCPPAWRCHGTAASTSGSSPAVRSPAPARWSGSTSAPTP